MLTPEFRSLLIEEINQRHLPGDFLSSIEQWYVPLAQLIVECKQHTEKETLLISFNGAQGSGKSTLTAFLRLILMHQFALNTVDMSIDDFYLTHAERVELSKQVHPLFITRGVPGTHDVMLAKNIIQCLQHCAESEPCSIPVFDKAIDDRRPQSDWLTINQPVDIILFEGWCNHSPVQPEAELHQPINRFEREEDAQAVWRSYVNEQLKLYHDELFSLSDMLVFLQVPGFEKVYEWRGLQEKKLAQSGGENKAVMNERQLERFIHHYERITRYTLAHLADDADVVLKLNEQHGIVSMLKK